MSIQGPLPPSSVPPGYSQGSSPQLPAYAQASLCSQLAGVEFSPLRENAMTAAQQNTFWLLRMCSDISLLYVYQAHGLSSSMTQGVQNDFQFILQQVQSSGTNFDPQLMTDLQTFINNPNSFSSNFGPYMTNYTQIIQGNPPSGYNTTNTPYSFTQDLSPDDSYYAYLVQIGIGVYNADHGIAQNNFWPLTSDRTSLLGSEFGQFICTYFVQRDGWGTAALKNDLQNFDALISPIGNYIQTNWSQFPALNAAFQGGTDPQVNNFAGLDQDLQDLVGGTWDFGAMPVGDNKTPPPFWDVTSSTKIQWNYGFDTTFLGANDMYLAQYMSNWQ
jgi:hypothetical protein